MAYYNESNTKSLGCKLKSIYTNRCTGKDGDFLSSHGNTVKCLIDGIVFSITRHERKNKPLWVVLNVLDGSCVELRTDEALKGVKMDCFKPLVAALFKSAMVF